MRFIGDPQPGKPLRWWHPFLSGLVCSLLWSLGFVFIHIGGPGTWAAPIAMGGLFGLAAVVRSGGASLRLRGRLWMGSLVFGLGFAPALGVAHAYIIKTAAPAYPLLLLYLCLFPALAAFIAARVNARWPRIPLLVVVPVVWTALEYLRGEWLLGGYPWLLLGHTLTQDGGVSWLAPWIGVYGCSLLLAVIGVGELAVLSKFRSDKTAAAWTGVLGVGCAAFASLAFGARMSPSSQPPYRTLRVAVLQTNLPQDNKIGWRLHDRIDQHKHWLDLSRKAATAGGETKRPQLVVWPETMFPGQVLNPEALEVQRRSGLSYQVEGTTEPLAVTWFADTLLATQAELDIPFLVGAITSDNFAYERGANGGVKVSGTRYNSAVLVTDGRAQQERYDKIDLMAFGEYIPVVHRWPAVQNWLTGLGAQGMSFDLAFGKSRSLFNVEGVRIGTPICFEICHEGTCREFTTAPDGTRRADLLINVTNDGWFYDSDFNRRLHLLQACWRCAETGTPMVRAANTGISGLIDASGAVVTTKLDDGRALSREEGLVTVDVPVASDGPATVYARWGHLIGPVVGVCGAVLAVMAFWPRRRVS